MQYRDVPWASVVHVSAIALLAASGLRAVRSYRSGLVLLLLALAPSAMAALVPASQLEPSLAAACGSLGCFSGQSSM